MRWETTDPEGRSVRLYTDTLENHIKKWHSIVVEDVIRKTIEHPDAILQSSRRDSDAVYVKRGADSDYDHLYCKVVVGFETQGAGAVRTAMYTDRIGGVSNITYLQVSNRPQ